MERIIYRKTLDVHKNGIQFMLQGFETADNLSRVIEVSLMASGDAIDFPLEQMVAMMYVKTPSAKEPSINACTIKDNKVIYEVLPVVEEGITEMQIKLIETGPEGAKRVLCTPKFAVEVAKSDVDDEGAEQTTTFTALEDAVARANAAYDRRIVDINVDSECVFRIYYADGTAYETDELRRLILSENTDLNLDSLIKDGLLNITVEQVADELDEKYRDVFAKANFSENLFADYPKPTFVEWNEDTLNTPYKAGLTSSNSGFAFVFGTTIANHIVVSWGKGSDDVCAFVHKYTNAIDDGWDKMISASGGTMTGPLGLGNGKGSVSADEESAFLEASKDSENSRSIGVSIPTDNGSLSEAVKFQDVVNGVKTAYNLFGEHNPKLMQDLGYARMKYGTYVGTYESGETIIYRTFDFGVEAKVLFIDGRANIVRGAEQIRFSQNYGASVQWDGNKITISSSESSVAEWNKANTTYHYVVLY